MIHEHEQDIPDPREDFNVPTRGSGNSTRHSRYRASQGLDYDQDYEWSDERYEGVLGTGKRNLSTWGGGE